MTRHARNCTAGAVYSYHEKKKDAKASNYGSNSQRLGKDSVKDFDCCCMTLQPCRNPMISREGFLFDKEAILEYIIAKKKEYIRKQKEYERQLNHEQAELSELAAAEKRAKVEKFIQTETNIVTISKPTAQAKLDSLAAGPSSVSNMTRGFETKLPSFWVPNETPQASKTKLSKPEKMIFCPMSGKPLKVKDLINVKFTLMKDPDDKKSLIAKTNRYVCAVTNDILGNSVACAVIKTTGDVVTMECVDKLIKKDWIHPLTGDKLTESDIIPIYRGGTGYASVNDKLQATESRPVLQV